MSVIVANTINELAFHDRPFSIFIFNDCVHYKCFSRKRVTVIDNIKPFFMRDKKINLFHCS